MTDIYGIKNCDTMKKAFKWLDSHHVSYNFHDYKKVGADKDVLTKAMVQHGWDSVINRRGTTWRKLSDEQKSSMDDMSAVECAMENPSIIKRPLLITDADDILLGFDEGQYREKLL